MKFEILFQGTVTKSNDAKSEDNYKVSDTVIAVSDGATVAFNSEVWSRILARNFVHNSCIDEKWLTKAKRVFHRYHRLYYFKNNSIPWNVAESYEAGSYATLFGIQVIDKSKVKITSIGDIVAVHIRNGKFYSAFPIEDPKDFDNHPYLVSTNAGYNQYIDSDFLHRHTAKWTINSNSIILCMTDAVACWFLSNKELALKKISLLLQNKDPKKAFHNLVLKERINNAMKLDDSTLIVLRYKE